MLFSQKELNAFEKTYDTTLEDRAIQSRGAFIRAFPIEALKTLSLDTYVIGLKTATFCSFVEAKTRYWAAIQGATAFKFGVYFGKVKSDQRDKYRFTRKYGNTVETAFEAVKVTLLELVDKGGQKKPDFKAIDQNKLSPLFKAKILSLYFPDRFLAVCSPEHLEEIASKFELPKDLPKSEIQNRLIGIKTRNQITQRWSNPKFMRFLYETYIWKNQKTSLTTSPKPEKKRTRKVNFEDIQNQRGIIGKKAEKFALEWEKERLIGNDLEHLLNDIDDRTEQPSYGYDFLSHTAQNKPRYIEVKSISKQAGYHRFFLSESEYAVSTSKEHRDAYYFYLVSFDGEGNAIDLEPRLAKKLFKSASLEAASYTVHFSLGQPKNGL